MTPSTHKQLIICADDYGQNLAISEGIVHLASLKRINATSCMVNTASWAESSTALRPLQPTTFIGLHLNFTHGDALSSAWKKHCGTRFSGISTVLKNAYLKRLNPAVIRAEIQMQVEFFTHAMNARPDFIDGHQHVHQLPIIRETLLALYADKLDSIFIRKTSQGWRDLFSMDGFPKRQLITLLGGVALQHDLIKQSIPCNSSFSGIYNFKQAANYSHYFKRFLENTLDGGLIMCHPGNASVDKSDPLHLYREQELNYFISEGYLRDLADHSFQLRCKHGSE